MTPAPYAARAPRPRSAGVLRAALGALVLSLAVVLVPPAPAEASEIGSFDSSNSAGFQIDYLDYTMINASSTPMVVLAHSYENGRNLAGNELYDNSVLTPGDFAEYASKGADGQVGYRWILAGTKYQVLFRSSSDQSREHISCLWTQNGDYEHEIFDVPYTCAVDVQQGQYGHTTEYMTVADKDPKALDDDHQATTLRMVDKLCADNNNGKSYPASCQVGYDLTGNGPKPVVGRGLPTVVTEGQNCLSDRDMPLSRTESFTVANTVGWQETTSLSASFKWIWPMAYELTVSLSQSYAYSSSTTTSTTDTSNYSVPVAPRTAAQLVVTYPVLRLTTGMKARFANSAVALDAISVTLRQPDAHGVQVAKPTTFDPSVCGADNGPS